MKVKELFELITPASDPEIVVYDYKTNETVTYNWLLGNDYMQQCVERFGDRVIMKGSAVFGENISEEPFLHFVVE